MKRTLLYFIIGLVGFSSCKKDDDPVFSESPDARINRVLGEYQTALAGSPNGWNAELRTAAGGIYHFHFSFNNANRVQMFGDIDTISALDRKESSFRLKALQQPSLIFDTYSYLHQLADPDGSVNGGEYGEGLSSDFEFSLDTLTTDSIKLTGRFKGSKMVMKKATQQDLQAWQSGQWKNVLLFEYSGARILNYFKRLVIGATSYEIRVNPLTRTITLIWVDAGGAGRQHTTAYYFTSQGVQFVVPLVNGATTINALTNITWNPVASVFQLNINGGAAATIAGAIAPIIRDLNGPTRWWQTVGTIQRRWISLQGFHVNGVDDAYKITEIPDFIYLGFFAEFGTSGGVRYDLAGYVLPDGGAPTIFFGTAFRPPTFTADGRIIFRYLGDLGDITPDVEDAYVNTAIQFLSPQGYYLVQTSATTYDMVSALDAKAWITWFR